MKLTSHTDYSLRTLIYVGCRDGALVPIGDVANAYGISKSHLLKVAANLSAGRFVDAVRGNGGGIRLARSAHLINIGQVVRHTEPDMDLVQCFCRDGARCRIESGCTLRSILHRALGA